MTKFSAPPPPDVRLGRKSKDLRLRGKERDVVPLGEALRKSGFAQPTPAPYSHEEEWKTGGVGLPNHAWIHLSAHSPLLRLGVGWSKTNSSPGESADEFTSRPSWAH